MLMMVLQVLRLPRKMKLVCPKCCAEGTPSAAPATQDQADVLQVLRLPRQRKLMRSKCCACHAKASGAQVTQDVARLPRTSMKVLQELHVPSKTKLCR